MDYPRNHSLILFFNFLGIASKPRWFAQRSILFADGQKCEAKRKDGSKTPAV